MQLTNITEEGEWVCKGATTKEEARTERVTVKMVVRGAEKTKSDALKLFVQSIVYKELPQEELLTPNPAKVLR